LLFHAAQAGTVAVTMLPMRCPGRAELVARPPLILVKTEILEVFVTFRSLQSTRCGPHRRAAARRAVLPVQTCAEAPPCDCAATADLIASRPG
jgi:hypothetical protein